MAGEKYLNYEQYVAIINICVLESISETYQVLWGNSAKSLFVC